MCDFQWSLPRALEPRAAEGLPQTEASLLFPGKKRDILS